MNFSDLKKWAGKVPTHFLKAVKLDEVSLVDTPANQETNVTIYKREHPVTEDLEERELTKRLMRQLLSKMEEDDEEKHKSKVKAKEKEVEKEDDDDDDDEEVEKRWRRRRMRKRYIPQASYSRSQQIDPEVQGVMKRMASQIDRQDRELSSMRDERTSEDVLRKCAALGALPAPPRATEAIVAKMADALTEREFGEWFDYMERVAKSVEALPIGELGFATPYESAALDEIESLVNREVSKSDVSREQAYERVLKNNPHLYEQTLVEGA